MKTKICPCCDQPIKGIYCRGCRKIVLNPVEQNITYYLNRRHPEFETDCSFHNDVPRSLHDADGRYRGTDSGSTRSAAGRMTAAETEAKKEQIRARMASGKQNKKPIFHPTVLNGDVIRKPNSSGKNPATSSAAKKIIIGIVVYLIVVFGGVIGMMIGNIADVFEDFELGNRTPEIMLVPEPVEAPLADIDWNASEAVQNVWEETPLDDWGLTDEEVKAAGTACTGYGHFEVTYEEIETEFLEVLKADGLYCTAEESYSYNSQMELNSWYQTVYGYTIEKEDRYMGTVEIETDTATGQIHGISLYTSSDERVVPLLDSVLRFMEGTGLTEGEVPSGNEFLSLMINPGEGAVEVAGGTALVYGLEVNVYVDTSEADSPFYSISMHAPRDMAVEE